MIKNERQYRISKGYAASFERMQEIMRVLEVKLQRPATLRLAS